MLGKPALVVLGITALAFIAPPLGATAAQIQSLPPIEIGLGCAGSCDAPLVSPYDPADAARDRAPAPAPASSPCPIRAGCRQPATAAAAIAVQYVEPPPEEPAPAAAGGPPPSRVTSSGGSVVLGVPVYGQIWNLDCETAALQMALAYSGSYYPQPALFGLENADLRPPILDGAGNIVQWGDPYTNFVGNVMGTETGKTGYGVYWPVILSIARSHGAPSSYGGEGFSSQTVYAALAARHPVEVWINYGFTTYGASTWRAWDGRTIRYTLHEHAVTLTGVSASGVLVNDPWPGSQYWVSKGAFEASWAVFGNMAVVVQ